MELTHGSETSAYYTMTPGKYPKENIQYFVLFYVLFVLCRSLYCLCVYVYCTTATGWLPNCSEIYIISYIRTCDNTDTSNTGKKLKFTITELTTTQLVTCEVTKLRRALRALGITQAALTSTVTSYS